MDKHKQTNKMGKRSSAKVGNGINKVNKCPSVTFDLTDNLSSNQSTLHRRVLSCFVTDCHRHGVSFLFLQQVSVVDVHAGISFQTNVDVRQLFS